MIFIRTLWDMGISFYFFRNSGINNISDRAERAKEPGPLRFFP